VPLILEQNIRNTRQIARAFEPLVDHPMRLLGADGPDVRFVPCTRDNAFDVGDDQIEALLNEGWRPEDVALLTTGSRHPEQIARQTEGNAAYWDSFWDAEQVFYGTCWVSRDLSGARWCSSSTINRCSNVHRNGCTSGCRGPEINSWCAQTRRLSPRWADGIWFGGWV
jgi:hypothetical protein